MKKCFDPINVDDFSRRFSLCQRFLHISHQMMSYIDFSNFHFFNFFQFRAMKLPLKPGCRANCFASFGPVYSLIGAIWTDFIKNPKIINYIKNGHEHSTRATCIYIYIHICIDICLFV